MRNHVLAGTAAALVLAGAVAWIAKAGCDVREEPAAEVVRAGATDYVDALYVQEDYARALHLMCEHDTAALGGMSEREFSRVAGHYLPERAARDLPVTAPPRVSAIRWLGTGAAAELDVALTVTATVDMSEATRLERDERVKSVHRTESGTATVAMEVSVPCRGHRDGDSWHFTVFDEARLRRMAAELVLDTWSRYVEARRAHDWHRLSTLYAPASGAADNGSAGLRMRCEAQDGEVGAPFHGGVGSWKRVSREGNEAALSVYLFFREEGEDAESPLYVVAHFVYDDAQVRWLLTRIEEAPDPERVG
jgi:hypothetical protein